MAQIVRFGGVGELIDKLNRRFEEGEIEGLIVCIKYRDGTFGVAWTEGLTHIERLGLLEAAKGECHHQLLCACEW